MKTVFACFRLLLLHIIPNYYNIFAEATDFDVYKDRPILSRWKDDVVQQLNPELTEANVILEKVKNLVSRWPYKLMVKVRSFRSSS